MDETALTPVTRLAPSPTGALHLGNARTFLINWAMARRRGWRIVFRMEDLDGPRVKAGADQTAIEDLTWLGLDWDGEPTWQRSDLTPYRTALQTLHGRGEIYPCTCTRRDIRRARSAPHADEHELRYPGTCRSRPASQIGLDGPADDEPASPRDADHGSRPPDPACWRLFVPDEPVTFTDEIAGPQTFDVQRDVGDFVVATKAGLPAYQLAVVVDDARQRVSDVVRGDDLLSSSARQIWLYRMLGLAPLPRTWHLPLVLGFDGHRLAKRHGNTRLSRYRQLGVPSPCVVGLLAAWCGLLEKPRPMEAAEFLDRFDLDLVPRTPVTFTEEDHEWLVGAVSS